ncbi:hypothetical protein BJ994_000865 [Arthrobacter pigmenti]|uniref:Uncharacterized protein n=1 Tax=Arthrobacter pigmenti TaxID=271432 RepID=A0A846RKZ2_9MICC|nr:hypothetical protein [Arthrobacter pigmenti]NJC21789.1 hypothetical protein [Arthrobacter pigmenti]
MAHPVTSEKPKRPTHSGDGHLLENLLVYAVMLALFLGSIYIMSFGTKENVWPFAISLVLGFLAFWIPQTILGRSDTGGQIAKGERKA